MKKLTLFCLGILFITSPLWAVGVNVGSNCVISWTANTEPDLASYKLFVGTVTGAYGPPQSITAPASQITCIVAGITTSGQKYITLSSLDTAGNESAKAVEVPFTLDSTAPAAPVGLKVQ